VGQVTIELLGGFGASAGGEEVPDNAWRLRKARELVKLLALARGHRLHREQAMDALWPELDALAAANQAPAINPKPDKDADNAKVFAEKGETDFKARDYKAAVYAWKHAVVDDPTNGVLTMMLGQGFFATGQYNEAAGAVQQAMQILPKEEWGVVVKNYKELYTNIQDFTDQLRALEKAVKEKPNDPALRFLAGFEYAYLGYPKEAVGQLEKGLKVAPRDEMAKKLRDEMAAKLKSAEPPAPGLK
jgi:tetratricopeptide (TPR) repeat protein